MLYVLMLYAIDLDVMADVIVCHGLLLMLLRTFDVMAYF